MRKTRRGATLCAALALSWATACGKAPAEEAPPSVAVTVSVVGRADVSEILTLRGRLVPSAEEDATLAPQAAGRLVRVAVREGDAVARGALLAEVERAPLEEAAATAVASLVRARGDEAVKERAAALTESLLQKGIASAEERDNDRAASQAARAARVEAEGRQTQATRQLDWTSLRAPFDGVVAQVLRHPGEVVDGTGATPVLRLLGTSVQEVSASATADDLARVRVGGEASVTLPGSAAPVVGRVLRVARAVDPASGVGEIRLRLAEKSVAPLLSAVPVAVVVAVHRGVVVVPPASIRKSQAGTEEVVVVEKGAAKARPVRTALRSADRVEIVEGLSGGETVIVDSPLGLGDGQPLTVRTAPGR